MNDDAVRFADLFSAMGSEPRLRTVRLLLSAHPSGMTVTELQWLKNTVPRLCARGRARRVAAIRLRATYNALSGILIDGTNMLGGSITNAVPQVCRDSGVTLSSVSISPTAAVDSRCGGAP